MAKRGRPTKILSFDDLLVLRDFLTALPFQTAIQSQIMMTLKNLTPENFNNIDESSLKRMKDLERYRIGYLERESLLEQIKLKEKNQQKLVDNEVEILTLANQELDRDTYFRLDRALQSYQKIYKAVFNDRIRLENEHRRNILNQSRKTLTEAQIKRNEENRRKYELGGAVLAAFKKLNIDIEKSTPEQIQNRIINTHNFVTKVKSSEIFKLVQQDQKEFFNQQNLFIDVLEALNHWTSDNKKLALIAIEKHKSKYDS